MLDWINRTGTARLWRVRIKPLPSCLPLLLVTFLIACSAEQPRIAREEMSPDQAARLEQLAESLRSGSGDVEMTLREIESYGAAAEQIYLDQLRHPEPVIREWAADQIGRWAFPSAAPALLEALLDPANAPRTVHRIEKEGEDYVYVTFRDRDTQTAMVLALANLGDEAIEPMERFIREQDDLELRKSVRYALETVSGRKYSLLTPTPSPAEPSLTSS